ncbi:hypothetical protein C1701_04930 [Actinoalloteichus sp. AHMU CJ021]|uniref:Lipoprotein n=1 Tax=Actinoalloteichus caeruleus DSM 43889 TaxID=1120930 RepID=A0ABT1JH20_ACTCY|nr:hypothetical protein [Actinoalloteichus caeruleus]AUS77811.1 hypothetical protein C1701_04930 [Actinoalloteichus sp. AHMU CJ021]MCP2331767.1 hypothetical protein [Actinoalloteichus caeruleus DSM 43889]
MRRLTTAVGAGVLFLGISACADSNEDSGVGLGGQPSQAPPTSSEQEAPPSAEEPETRPAEAVDVPEEQVDTAAIDEGYPVEVWTLDEGAVLGAMGQEGGCGTVSASATEDEESVTLLLTEDIPTSGPCTMDIRFRAVSVDLDQPLGDRTVVLETETVGPPSS